ncbi:hypothetical protein FHL15_010417 [Xylaria flabelliformis]|uniref:Uncharacterized protein n=1 Tax=Xylaria flabelliformis TaxID=2512241 RepID=A0A553HL30_9PEZI|nr:hypothetical protein FHL15_010417 [Xylaria flabelliformis]
MLSMIGLRGMAIRQGLEDGDTPFEGIMELDSTISDRLRSSRFDQADGRVRIAVTEVGIDMARHPSNLMSPHKTAQQAARLAYDHGSVVRFKFGHTDPSKQRIANYLLQPITTILLRLRSETGLE